MSQSSHPAPQPPEPPEPQVQTSPEPQVLLAKPAQPEQLEQLEQPAQPAQPEAPFVAAPPAPLPAPQSRVGLGILAGVAAMAVGALVYGFIMAKSEHEVGFVALFVGALVGAALGKVGGRSPVLPIVGIVLGLFGVFAGQLLGAAMWISDATDGAYSTMSVFTDHFSPLFDAWKEDLDFMSAVFFAIAGAEGFLFTKRLAG